MTVTVSWETTPIVRKPYSLDPVYLARFFAVADPVIRHARLLVAEQRVVSWLAAACGPHVTTDDLLRGMELLAYLRREKDYRNFTPSEQRRWEALFSHPLWETEENPLAKLVAA